MELKNLESVSRKKNHRPTQRVKDSLEKIRISNKFDRLNQIVAATGSAKRKPLQKSDENGTGNTDDNYCAFIQKESYREDFSKLRAPYGKSRSNKFSEEKSMSKSCEIIFDWLNLRKIPLKDSEMKIKRETKCVRSIFRSTNYEAKATRKVQFLKVCEETPIPGTYFDGYELLREFKCNTSPKKTQRKCDLPPSPNLLKFHQKNQIKTQVITRSAIRRKAISSEDFINDVFSGGTANSESKEFPSVAAEL